MNLLMWRPTPRTLVIGILSTLALVLVAGGAWFWSSTQQERIQAAHADALSQAYAARNPQAAADARARAAAALETALTQAPNAPLAMQSAYELGNIRFDSAQYAAARAAYDIALRNGGRSSATLRALARAGIASAWEAQRDFPRAAESYTAALGDAKPGQFYYEELLISLGRVQELAGRRDDAIQSYRRLLKDVPTLKRESEIRGRLASLGVSVNLR